MKKTLKIALIFFSIFALFIGSLAYWQRTNLKALYIAATHDADEIIAQMRAQDMALKNEVAVYFSEGIRDFTEEERAQIKSGKVSEKQLLAKIIAESATQPEKPADREPAPEKAPESEKAPAPEKAPEPVKKTKQQKTEEIISRYVASLYNMEDEYLGKIEALISSAISEYKAKRTGKNDRSLQLSIGAAYTGQFTALEGECDAKVASLLTQMTADLNAIGADTSIIATIQSAYDGEKTLKRAYYMDKYGV